MPILPPLQPMNGEEFAKKKKRLPNGIFGVCTRKHEPSCYNPEIVVYNYFLLCLLCIIQPNVAMLSQIFQYVHEIFQRVH